MALGLTLAVVIRETLSETPQRLAALLKATTETLELIVVNAGLPPDLAAETRRIVEQYNGRVINLGGFATPNESRNAALTASRTKFIAFVDNDVQVMPGWLSALTTCAEETGAAIVGPLVYELYPAFTTVHVAGGDGGVVTLPDGRRSFWERHNHAKEKVPPEQLRAIGRQKTGLVEFHTILIDADWLRARGGLDPEMASLAEHWDLCLMAKADNRDIYFEPASVINYTPPRRLTADDQRYYALRWSQRWHDITIRRLIEKYALAKDDPGLHGMTRWFRYHQAHPHTGLQRKLSRYVGRHFAGQFVRHIYLPFRNRFGRNINQDIREWTARRTQYCAPLAPISNSSPS